ncbi:MAG: hypothetical protein IKP95_06830 [Ruminococcus sp.]|nr:hypothetical protein [Ruminococcus sp.]
MAAFIILWAACILFSFGGYAVKELYRPVKIPVDLLLTSFLLLTLGTQLAAIYYTAQRSAFFSMAAVIAFDCYWFSFAPFYPNSDAAGNGMARAFRSVFIVGGALVFGLISFFLIKFLTPGGKQVGLYIVLAFAAQIGLYNLLHNRSSFLSGDSFDEAARWAKLRQDDYRKTLFRAGMVEKNDSWQAKELDASPEELTHWDVYGSKCVDIKTFGLLPCLLLEGRFDFPIGTFKARRTGLVIGCLGYTNEGDANDRTYFMPHDMTLVWNDLSDGRTYRIETSLPKELDRYFEDTDRFWLDDIEFRIMPGGRVLMYHNRRNQIHNIMIDHPLQSEVTEDHGEKIAELISEYKIDVNKCRAAETPSPDTVGEYLNRFAYRILFRAEEGLKITKTICNFFNGEKILSDSEWKEDMDPARIKDVFVRFESEQQRYAAFIYFSEDEIVKTFDEAFENCDTTLQGEFIIRAGTAQNEFSFALKLGKKSFDLKETEIRLYTTNANDAGKLVFKNYKGEHKNRLSKLEVKLKIKPMSGYY